MISIARQYTKEIYKEMRYLPTWLPNDPIRLGDIGIFFQYTFQRMSSLEELGIEFKTRKAENTTDIRYHTKGAVNVHVNNKTDLNQGLNISVEFNRENTALLHVTEGVPVSIENYKSVGDAILKLHENGEWDKRYSVITDIFQAESATILIASQKNAGIHITSNLGQAFTEMNLANLNAEAGVTSHNGIQTMIIAKKKLTPLFRTRRIKKPLFRKSEFLSAREETPAAENLLHFDYLTPEDLDDGQL
jgi:hypothetical protein